MAYVWLSLYLLLQILTSPAAAAQAPDDAEAAMILQDARGNSLNYARHLPDFLCTELVRRFQAYGPTGNFRQTDSLTVQVTYFKLREEYKLTARNNKPTRQKLESVGGAVSQGEFGSTLLLLFHPDSAAQFTFRQWTTIGDRRAALYVFQIDSAHSHYEIKAGTYSVFAAYGGEVYIDAATHMVLRIIVTADVPAGFPVQYSKNRVDYDYVDVSGREYLLPVRCESESADLPLIGRTRTASPLMNVADQVRYRNLTEFRDYRKYAAKSTLTFDTVTPPKQ